MNKEIVTDPLTANDLWSDLKHNVSYLLQQDIKQVHCLFGYSWGNYIYKDCWHDLPIDLENLEALIKRYEALKYGRLGDDNMYINVPELDTRICYSHEADIHLSFSNTNLLVENILHRWDSDQWRLYGKA